MAKPGQIKRARPQSAPFPWLGELAATREFWLPRAALIAALTLCIYEPALRGGWIWDDTLLIVNNPLMAQPDGWWKTWTEPGVQYEYYPITNTLRWLEWQWWAPDTLGFHLVNVVLHFVDALLVWRLFAKLGLKFAWLGGLLFAAHPVQVESVAWIAELKNDLSLAPLLLAMNFQIDFEETKAPRDSRWALGLFAIALLCKLSVVFFPFVILLYAWWKRGRLDRRDAKITVPFFAVAALIVLITIVGGAWDKQFGQVPVGFAPEGGIIGRAVLALQAGTFYFAKVFLPVNLMPIYPMWRVDIVSPLSYLPLLAWAMAIFWLWKKRAGWGRHALLGLGFFAINLAPCPGFLAKPNMGYAWVTDHFLYLPIIGLIGLVIAAMGQLADRAPAPRTPWSLACILVAILFAWQSRGYAGEYRDENTYWITTLRANPNAWAAYENLGSALMNEDRNAEALAADQQLLILKPDMSDTHYSLGSILQKLGQDSSALDEYQQALRLDPTNGKVAVSEGTLLATMGKPAEAIAQYRQAISTIPDDAQLRYNLGSLLLGSGDVPGAIEQLTAAVQLDPELAKAQENLGSALAQSGRVPEAIPHFSVAVEIDPGYVIARNNLALALAQTGHIAEAVEQFQHVLEIDPGNAKARDSLAKLQAIKR